MNKTGKLLAWQIHSIKTDDGRYLENPKDINSEFKNYYQALYKTDHDNDNTGIKTILTQ